MYRLQIYLLAAALAAAGIGLFTYKVFAIGFPLSPRAETQVWNVEARVKFKALGKPVKVTLFVPSSAKNYAIADERFISGDFGFVLSQEDGNRKAKWAVRKASGKQTLYYQAAVIGGMGPGVSVRQKSPQQPVCELEGPRLEAAEALLKEVKTKSADTPGMVETLLQVLNEAKPDDNVKLLLSENPSGLTKVKTAISILSCDRVPARIVHGIRLKRAPSDPTKKVPVLAWLEVYDNGRWLSFHPLTGASPVPEEWFTWWRGPEKLVDVEGGAEASVAVSVSPKIETGVAGAIRRGTVAAPSLLRFSLLSLPVNTQAVYRIMLLVPVGALLLVILRNVVGIKTFGTFMPVLIALSFRETGLLKGLFLFTVLICAGLAIRFYLERLKLLAVPRLAAVLIVVVIMMGMMSIVTHQMGGHTGLSVALFPMVIVTMTIERMSIVWEERGAAEALISGAGSLVTAAVAFAVMNIKYVEHLVFVFPELLLVLLAVTILLGRYTGYRLTDLYRFRELTRV